MALIRKTVVGGDNYRMRFFINGWEQYEGYFRSIGRFNDNQFETMLNGETIEKNGNTFSIRYENEYGNLYVVNDVLNNNI